MTRVKDLDTATRNENSIAGLEERISNAEQTNDMCELVLIAKELIDGSGSQQAVDALITNQTLTEVRRPVLRVRAEEDDVGKMFSTIETFIGAPEFVPMETADQKASITQLVHTYRPHRRVFLCLSKFDWKYSQVIILSIL
jgi:hypothetical protein